MNNSNIEAVINLVNGTSDKYIHASFIRLPQADILIVIWQIKRSVLCKYIWLKYKEGSETDYEKVMKEETFDEEDLSKKLRHKSKSAMKG